MAQPNWTPWCWPLSLLLRYVNIDAHVDCFSKLLSQAHPILISLKWHTDSLPMHLRRQ
jgi:hypothetical protein